MRCLALKDRRAAEGSARAHAATQPQRVEAGRCAQAPTRATAAPGRAWRRGTWASRHHKLMPMTLSGGTNKSNRPLAAFSAWSGPQIRSDQSSKSATISEHDTPAGSAPRYTPRPPLLGSSSNGGWAGRNERVVAAPFGTGTCTGEPAIAALESVKLSTTPPSTRTTIEISACHGSVATARLELDVCNQRLVGYSQHR